MLALTDMTFVVKHRPPYASKNGHKGVVKLLGLRKNAAASMVWSPGYLFSSSLLEVEDGDVVSYNIAMLTCSDTTCQPTRIRSFTSRASPVFILLQIQLLPNTILVNHISL